MNLVLMFLEMVLSREFSLHKVCNDFIIIILQLCACTLLGIGIWMAVDRAFMATITGEPLYAVAIYIMLAGAAIMFIIAFLACCGAISENKLMLWIVSYSLSFNTFFVHQLALLFLAFSTENRNYLVYCMQIPNLLTILQNIL